MTFYISSVFFFLFFFFFSSRRRHTRSLRDWSSDVCSSDLDGFLTGGHRRRIAFALRHVARQHARRSVPENGDRRFFLGTKRSEERRVGKECRSRWWP